MEIKYENFENSKTQKYENNDKIKHEKYSKAQTCEKFKFKMNFNILYQIKKNFKAPTFYLLKCRDIEKF